MNFSRLIKNCTPLVSRWILAGGSRCQSTSAGPLVQVDVNDQSGVAIVSLSRKPVNALSLELFKEFCGVMDDLEKSNIRGMILKSVCKNLITSENFLITIFYLLSRWRMFLAVALTLMSFIQIHRRIVFMLTGYFFKKHG